MRFSQVCVNSLIVNRCEYFKPVSNNQKSCIGLLQIIDCKRSELCFQFTEFFKNIPNKCQIYLNNITFIIT